MTNAPPTEEDLLLAFLAQRDARCTVCGYSLLGAASPICPECGAVARLALREHRPSAWVFVAGLLPLAMGAGFGSLALAFLMAIGASTIRGWGAEERMFLMYAAAHVPPLGLWIALRRRIEAMRPAPGALLAGLAWGLGAGAFIALCIYI